MKISVVGLGKLGAPILAVLAAKGNSAIGIDLSPVPLDKINAGIAPVDEPGLQAMITAHRARISATSDWTEAVVSSDATFVMVPTPSGDDGTFSNEHVLAAVAGIGRELRSKPGYHLVVVSSTVMPGAMDGPIRACLEQASGRRDPDGIGLCYNPSFIALGSVLDGLLHPDFVLIGESDSRAGDLLEEIQRGVVGNAVPIRRMNSINAEIAKLSVNAFAATKISFANMLSEICGETAGADVDVVTAAIGLDSRIGHKFLRGGTAYGGPCFPRDTTAFCAAAVGVGLSASLVEATETINARQTARIIGIIESAAPRNARIALLGMAYKAGTPVIEKSAGIDLARYLVDAGYAVVVHDEKAMDAARLMLGDAVTYAGTLAQATSDADVIVILTPAGIYRDLVALKPSPPVVVDCWRILSTSDTTGRFRVIHLGRGGDDVPDRFRQASAP